MTEGKTSSNNTYPKRGGEGKAGIQKAGTMRFS